MLFSAQPEDVLSAGEICPEVLSECVKNCLPSRDNFSRRVEIRGIFRRSVIFARKIAYVA